MPKSTLLAVHDIKRTIGCNRSARGPVSSLGRIAVARRGTGKTLDEVLQLARLAGPIEWQKYNIIATMALLRRRTGAAVINHESAAAIGPGKLLSLIEHQIQRRLMRGKRGERHVIAF